MALYVDGKSEMDAGSNRKRDNRNQNRKRDDRNQEIMTHRHELDGGSEFPELGESHGSRDDGVR